MLTEYHTEKEIIRDLNLASTKAYEMVEDGWFHNKLERMYKKNRKGGCVVQEYTINKQVYKLVVSWTKYKRNVYNIGIETEMDTNNGKTRFLFTTNNNPIIIASPHFTKRISSRCEHFIMFNYIFNQGSKYRRNGRDYELIKNINDIYVVRRSKENSRIIYAITALSMDMCTNKNYQELLSRIDSIIDTNDVYEWQ